jgi:sugar-specific transcriptional regulator TrmB
MTAIPSYLQKFGLSEIEIRIYLGLLEYGASSISDLANNLELKRTTTHINVESLIRKGLVSQTKVGSKRQVIAESPENLTPILEKKKAEIKSLERFLPNLIEDITKEFPHLKDAEKVSIKYYEGKDGVRSIYREVLKSYQLRSYVNISKIFELFPENPELFPQNVDKGHLHMWEIIEDSEISRNYVLKIDPAKYKYKFFPKQWNVTVFDYMIFDNKIAIITGEADNMSGIVISSVSIYENAKVLFDMMWALLPESG